MAFKNRRVSVISQTINVGSAGPSSSEISPGSNLSTIDVDWSTATGFYKVLDNHSTYDVNFSNLVDGKTVTLDLQNDIGTDQTIQFNGVDNLKTFSIDNKVSGVAQAITRTPDGGFWVGGYDFYAGGSGQGFVKFSSTGDLVVSNAGKWDPDYWEVRDSILQPDGKVIFSGEILTFNGGGPTAVYRLNSNGSLDSYNPPLSNPQYGVIGALGLQSDGKILLGGNFTVFTGTANVNRLLIRTTSSGSEDLAFTSATSSSFGTSGFVYSIKVQSDGKILVGGSFLNYGGVSGRSNLVRLNSDGTLDTAFTTNASNGGKLVGICDYINVQSDGKILVSGRFINYGGVSGRNNLVRLNSDGTLDTTFTANASDGGKFNGADGMVFSTKQQSDGKILVAGRFTNYGGVSGRNNLVRLNLDGTVDSTFCINASDGGKFNTTVLRTEILTDGSILVGGQFSNYLGVNGRNTLVRLKPDGKLYTAGCITIPTGKSLMISLVRIYNKTLLLLQNLYE